jgi:hypothetical protein
MQTVQIFDCKHFKQGPIPDIVLHLMQFPPRTVYKLTHDIQLWLSEHEIQFIIRVLQKMQIELFKIDIELQIQVYGAEVDKT